MGAARAPCSPACRAAACTLAIRAIDVALPARADALRRPLARRCTPDGQDDLRRARHASRQRPSTDPLGVHLAITGSHHRPPMAADARLPRTRACNRLGTRPPKQNPRQSREFSDAPEHDSSQRSGYRVMADPNATIRAAPNHRRAARRHRGSGLVATYPKLPGTASLTPACTELLHSKGGFPAGHLPI